MDSAKCQRSNISLVGKSSCLEMKVLHYSKFDGSLSGNFEKAHLGQVNLLDREPTKGVLASKFPISIRTQTQGQYRCQIVRKILKNHVPVSDFATILLNLRKTQKSEKFCKKKFFLVKKCN